MTSTANATLKGYATILLWSLAALCIEYTGDIPPFLLASFTSCFGFTMFAGRWCYNRTGLHAALKQPLAVWLLFILAIIIYRATYLTALKLGPPIETNTIHYLWPLLIVLFSSLRDKIPLRIPTFAVAILGFLGAGLIGISKANHSLTWDFGLAHLYAFCAAVCWASYSVLIKTRATEPGDMVGLMHGIAATTFFILHYTYEPNFSFQSITLIQILAVAEVGLAISLGYSWWDLAMRRGNTELLAIRANLIPLLSTIWLILFSNFKPSFNTLLGALLIIGANLIAKRCEQRRGRELSRQR